MSAGLTAMLLALGALGTKTSLAPADAPSATTVHARLDLSQLVTGDDVTADHVSYTDLRVVADAAHLSGTKVSFHLDGRGRKGWNPLSPDRLTVTEAYVRYGEEGDPWRVSAGRQLIRSVASAEVDGIGVERQLGKDTEAVAFAGLMPHPLTGDPNADFLTAGLGYDRRAEKSNHSGGAVVSAYRGTLDRFYLNQSSYLILSPQWIASGFAIVDLAAPQGVFGGPGPDLTALNALVRFRPTHSFDSTLSVNHNHTLLPGKWWRDWLEQQRRALGFTLDGEQPVGTRITSARWTNVYWVSREAAPYVRLRYDIRHTDPARGYEAAAGFKWRPKLGYAEASVAYRRYFGSEGQLANLQAGVDLTSWGLEAGAGALRSRPLEQSASTLSFEAHAFAWVDLGGVRAMAEYQAFFQPQTTYQVVLGQLGYRF